MSVTTEKLIGIFFVFTGKCTTAYRHLGLSVQLWNMRMGPGYLSRTKNIGALERVQRKAASFVYNHCRRTDSPTALLQGADLGTLKSRAKLHRLKFFSLLVHN